MRRIALLVVVACALVVVPGGSGGQVGAQIGTDGGMRLTIVATPETAASIVPSVSLNGVDVFASNCGPSAVDVDPYTSQVTYDCTGLELAIYDVSAPAVAGIDQSLTCSPIGSFDGFDFTTADVSVDGFVYCSLSVMPPGFVVQLLGVDPAATIDLVVLDAAGNPVDANCRRDSPPGDEPRLHCGPLPFGEYEIPHQDVDGTGVIQPFVCYSQGPGPEERASDFDNTLTLEPRAGELDRYRWSCLNEEPPEVPVPTIALSIDADTAIADTLAIELQQGGVDVRGDGCQTAVAPGYLDAGTDGYRYSLCTGDWTGTITPVINAPAGYVIGGACFEQNPVLGVTGPSAIFGPTSNSHWICSFIVRRPGVLLVVSADGDAGIVDSMQLTSADGAAVTVPCIVEARASAEPNRTVMSCSPVPFEPMRVGALLAQNGSTLTVGCSRGRDLTPQPDLTSYVYLDADPALPWWTCHDVSGLLASDLPDPDEALPGLPATGSRETWAAMTLGLLLVLAGSALVASARRRTAGASAS